MSGASGVTYVEPVGLESGLPALYAALAKAQLELGGAAKDKANPFFGSKYADLNSVWGAWQEVGPKNGLCVIQEVCAAAPEAQGIMLSTTLAHAGGGAITSTSYWPASKKDPQAYGSAITYARRYTLAALVGVVAEDDDGNAASRAQQKSEDVAKFEAAVEKHAGNNVKLAVIRTEAMKAGLDHLVLKIDSLTKTNAEKADIK